MVVLSAEVNRVKNWCFFIVNCFLLGSSFPASKTCVSVSRFFLSFYKSGCIKCFISKPFMSVSIKINCGILKANSPKLFLCFLG